MALKLRWQPRAPWSGSLESAADAASFGSLEIELDGRTATLHEDPESKSLGRDVYGPLDPVAEWVAECYGHLVRSRRAKPPAGAPDEYEWERTHCLRYVGDGLLLPDITFAPEDSGTIRIDCLPAQAGPFRFVERLTSSLSTTDVRQALREFVEGILARLRATCPSEPRTRELEELWAVASDRKHHAYRRACEAGLLWRELSGDQRAAIEALPARGQHPVLDALVERAPVGELDRWVAWANEVEAGAAIEPAALREPLPPSRAPTAWERGWEDARRLRETLRIARPALASRLDGLADTRPAELLDPTESLVAWESGRRALRLAGSSAAHGAFHKVRDLHAILFEAAPRHAVLCSRRVAGSSSVANAFACEWLAPVDEVKLKLGGRRTLDETEVDALATELQAPTSCVRHQVENHRLARIEPA